MPKAPRQPTSYYHQIAPIRRRAPFGTKGHLLRLDEIAMSAGKIVTELFPLPDSEASAAEQLQDLGRMVDLLTPIEREAAGHKAMTSRAGLFQLLLAVADLHELIDTDDTEENLRIRHRRIAQYVESAIDFFEADTGIDREEVGGRYYAPRQQPLTPLPRRTS